MSMGLFSSKKTYVDSTIYNMAGDELERPNFLKTAVISKVLQEDKRYFGEFLQDNYLHGPGIRLRRFFRWAQDNYDYIGMPTSMLFDTGSLDNDVLASVISTDPNVTVSITKADSGLADFAYWAEQWMLANRPELVNTEWSSDFDDATEEVVITFEDETTHRFSPTGFVSGGQYIYVTYKNSEGEDTRPLQTGPYFPLGSGDPFPDVTGWTVVSETTTPKTTELQTLVEDEISYSDNRPVEYDSDTSYTTASYDDFEGVYERTEYMGESSDPTEIDSVYDQLQRRYHMNTGTTEEDVVVTEIVEDIGGGVIKTTKRTTSTETLVMVKRYRTDTQDTYLNSWGPLAIYIYRVGTGNSALDAMVNTSQGTGQYYPFIPVRMNNKAINETLYPQAYDLGKRAYKKAIGGNFDDLLAEMEDHESIDDMDYIYVTFGVSLNVRENACRKYLYHYFKRLMEVPSVNPPNMNAWESLFSQFLNKHKDWNDWKEAQSNPSDPLYGTVEPGMPDYPAPPSKEVRIKSEGTLPYNYDVSITWNDIKEVTGSGLAKAGAKKGELWFDANPTIDYTQKVYNKGQWYESDLYRKEVVRLYWQVDEDNWKALDLYGLCHRNYIYKGKFIEKWGTEAIKEDEESGFVIPMHYPTFREMSLKDSTQMSTACVFLMINCYLVKKTGFFSSGFFKIFLIVAVIAISVVTGGIGATSVGLLGANAAVGAAIGLTGLAAVIAGAAINAIAAMIVLKVIGKVSVAVFGERFGALIGAIVGMAMLQVGMSFQTGMPMFNWGNLSSIDNIMNLTSVVGDAYSQYMIAGAQNTIEKTQKLLEDYNKQSREIRERYAEEFGYGKASLNPLDLIDNNQSLQYIESGDDFLTRTLMTGTDLIDFQMTLLNDFVDLTLKLDLP